MEISLRISTNPKPFLYQTSQIAWSNPKAPLVTQRHQNRPINLREGLWHDLRSFIERSYSQILSEPANYRISTPGANIQGKGGFNTYHVHSNTTLACVYYVAVPEGSGMLNIMDPRPQCHFANQYCLFKNSSQIGKAQSIAVSISEGDLLIIPGWLMHSVEPNNSKFERISIPINIIRNKNWSHDH